jgi:cytochrome c
MMDSFELNKIMGAVLGTLLITLALNIFAGGIFAPNHPAKPGFEIAVTEAPAAGPAEAKAPEQPIEALLPTASAEKGAIVAKKCQACHDFTKGGPNKVGPNLYGVVGRPRAEHAGFNYTSAMGASHEKWTFDHLNQYLQSPRTLVPGTAMAFAGLPKETDRANLLVYLNTLSDNPQPLPKAPPPAEKKAEAPKGGEQKAAPAPQGQPQGQGEQKPAPAAQGQQPAQNGQPKAAAPAPQNGQPKAPAPAQPKAAPAPKQ